MTDTANRFTWLGHATVLIEAAGKRLLIDPWTRGNPSCPDKWKDPAALGPLDAILITHIHSDHVGDAREVCGHFPDAPVIAIVETCAWIQKSAPVKTMPMNIGGAVHAAGCVITMTPAFHSSVFVEKDGTVVNGGAPAGFVIRLPDGTTVYHAGDTSVFGDMALIAELYQPSLGFLPIGDLYTMGPRQAALATHLLRLERVVPIHWGTFPSLTGTPRDFRAAIGPDGAEVVQMTPGASIS